MSTSAPGTTGPAAVPASPVTGVDERSPGPAGEQEWWRRRAVAGGRARMSPAWAKQELPSWWTPLVVTTLVVASLVYWVLARDMWMINDDWTYLLHRSLSDPLTLLQPKSGHLQVPIVTLMQVLWETAGTSYQPWYVLPRMVVYGLFLWTWARTLVRIGTWPPLAYATMLVLSVSGNSDWIRAAFLAPMLVFLFGLPAVLELATSEQPTVRRRVIVGLRLVATVVTSSGGVILVGVAGLVALGRRNRWAWLPSVAAPLALWFVTRLFFPSGESFLPAIDAIDWLGLARAVIGLTADVLSEPFALPAALGLLLAAGGVVLMIVRHRQVPLDSIDLVFGLYALSYAGALVLVRYAGDEGHGLFPWYGFIMAIYVLPILLRRVPAIQAAWARATALVTVAVLLVLNVTTLRDELAHYAARGADSRATLETWAALRVDDPVTLRLARTPSNNSGNLNDEQVQQVIDHGLEPRVHDDLASQVHAGMHLRFMRARVAPCEDGQQALSVTDPPRDAIVASGDGHIALELGTDHGPGRVVLPVRGDRQVRIDDRVTGLDVEVVRGDVELCALS